jgi:type IV pilus assembly protein PilC
MVRAGEIGGTLDIILERLSTYIEKSIEFKQWIRRELVTPIIWGLVTILLGVYLMAEAAVRLKPALEAREISWTARLLLGVAGLIHAILPPLLLIAGLVAVVVLVGLMTESGRGQLGGILLRLPLLKGYYQKVITARFCRVLGTTMRTGVPILDGMDITAKSIGNKKVEDALMKARTELREGEGMTGPIKNANIFPPMAIQMMNAGEETGKLDEMLFRIADFYDGELTSPRLLFMQILLVGTGSAVLIQGILFFCFIAPLLK